MNWSFRNQLCLAPEGSGSGSTPSGPTPSGTSTSTPAAPASNPTPAPSAAPSPSPVTPSVAKPSPPVNQPTSAEPATPELPEVLDFSTIFGDDVEAVVSPAVPQATPAAPVQVVPSAAPATPVVVAPAPAQPTPQPGVSPSLQGTPSTEGAPAPQGPNPTDPASIAAYLQTNESAAVAHIAETAFALTKEEIEELDTNAVQAIPKLLAKGFVKAQQNMLNQLARIVPHMIQRQTEAVARNAAAESEFYDKWPGLKKDQQVTIGGQTMDVGTLVRRYAAVFRQQHPQATREELFANLGPMVHMAAGIPATAPTMNGSGTPAPQTNPMAQATPGSPTRVAAPTPFSPALSGPAEALQPGELNEVEAIFAHEG